MSQGIVKNKGYITLGGIFTMARKANWREEIECLYQKR